MRANSALIAALEESLGQLKVPDNYDALREKLFRYRVASAVAGTGSEHPKITELPDDRGPSDE